MRPMDTSSNGRSWAKRHPDLSAWALGLAITLPATLATSPAVAQEFTFHAEPAAGFWLDDPQMTRFTPGVYFAVRPGMALGRIVALQLSYAMLWTPAGDGFSEDGMAHFLLGGVRLRPLATLRPESEQLGGLFVDFNLGYVRTGELDRFGFDAGLGYDFQVTPVFALGPVVRYGQIVQADDRRNEDPNDAQFLTVGLDFAFGPAHEEKPQPVIEEKPAPVYEQKEELVCPEVPKCAEQEAPVLCPAGDMDADGVCDADDRCPTQAGPKETHGCPIDPCSGKPLVVLVQFEYDSTKMPVATSNGKPMDPVLDAVGDAIAQDPTCRVCIIGHTSEEGAPAYNQDLSRRRAAAVQGYLTGRGLTSSRMPVTGMGESCPLVPEASRPMNRRVEFRRLEEGESCPKSCTE